MYSLPMTIGATAEEEMVEEVVQEQEQVEVEEQESETQAEEVVESTEENTENVTTEIVSEEISEGVTSADTQSEETSTSTTTTTTSNNQETTTETTQEIDNENEDKFNNTMSLNIFGADTLIGTNTSSIINTKNMKIFVNGNDTDIVYEGGYRYEDIELDSWIKGDTAEISITGIPKYIQSVTYKEHPYTVADGSVTFTVEAETD